MMETGGRRKPKKKPGMPGQARGHLNYFCKIGCIDLPMPCDECFEAKARHDRAQQKGNQKKNLTWVKSYRLQVERKGIAESLLTLQEPHGGDLDIPTSGPLLPFSAVATPLEKEEKGSGIS